MMRKKNSLDIYFSFHYLLENFMNGYTMTNLSKLLYPIYDFQHISDVEILSNIKYNFPKTYKLIANKTDRISAKKMAHIISTFFQEFEPEHVTTKKKKIEIWRTYDEWLKEAKRKWDVKLNIISKIKREVDKKLKPYVLDFFIHGSFSTLDYTQWSDIDLLAILKKDTVNDPEKLLKARTEIIKINKFLYHNDPLQHHGIFILSENDLNTYIQSFFPVELFKYSTSFYGTKSLYVNIAPSRKYLIKTLKSLTGYIKKFHEKFSLYDWKLFCHVIQLIPSIYLECKGIYVYKKFSFNKARGDFSDTEWEIINDMTEIRNKFYYNPPWAKLFLIMPTYWYLVGFIRLFIKGPKNIGEFIRKGKIFAEIVESKVDSI